MRQVALSDVCIDDTFFLDPECAGQQYQLIDLYVYVEVDNPFRVEHRYTGNPKLFITYQPS